MIQCILLLVLGALSLVSCSEDDYVPELRFSIAVNEVADFSAKVTVTHTGTNRVMYYAFAVEGQISDIVPEIQKHKEAVLKDPQMMDVYDQKKRVVKLSGLLPETCYTCIVYGLDENENIIGTAASTCFTTKSSSIEFELNPKWAISYKGQSKYNNKTYSRIDINVNGDIEERYFIKIYEVSVINNYADLRSLLLKAYNDFNSERNDLENEYFWIEDNLVSAGSIYYYKYLTKGRYQAFAIGVDANGALTGHYACSEVFDFDHYELEPGYAELLGEWVITDGKGGEVFFSLSEKWANNTLTISGFGFNDCPLTLKYTPDENYLLTISGQSAKGISWGEEESKTMTLRAWYLDEEKNFKIYTSSIISTLARSKGKNDDGTYTFSRGFNIKLKNEENATTLGMLLTYYNEENKLFYFNSSKIQLPFMMRKTD